MLRKIGLLSCFVLLALVLSGCCRPGGEKPDANVLLEGNIVVSQDANPDVNGRPSPITIRIYQLRSAERFKNADFSALSDNDDAVLEDDLLFKEEMDAHPGTSIPFKRELQKGTRSLGLMAAFRDFRNATWHTSIDLPAADLFPVMIEIGESSVLIREP
uniref:Type VI secretion system protein VasD n=1 Tax=Candidatus Kentrum sp. MB TaxID=2138164 RepID=A0A450XS34_9GAMM|nr:MAG: type VI secretion system protein VasD [Candidatus Kentron sp. MB]VFK32083.1 MAG: type VI secretion system protein VasD [Candidatus Kentron sp. MB]VFK75651.1 MAG: type VI secretion system protein VasD [Candidatus Kentron sp. MB]